jgi:hypothetical protein
MNTVVCIELVTVTRFDDEYLDVYVKISPACFLVLSFSLYRLQLCYDSMQISLVYLLFLLFLFYL